MPALRRFNFLPGATWFLVVAHPRMTPDSRTAILLGEAYEDDELLTRRVFKRSGIENRLVIAKSGPEVLALLAQGIEPLVVMLEIALPVMSGAGVLAAIRSDQRLAHTPVIMLTGGPEDRARLSLDRLTACLPKPIDFAPL